MNRAVIADHRGDGRRQPNHCRRDMAVPSAAVVELGEDCSRVVSRRQHPQWNDDRKESHDMQDQYQALHHREALGEEGIEEDREARDGDDQQRAMPSLEIIRGIVQHNEPLDDCPGEKGNGYDRALPAHNA